MSENKPQVKKLKVFKGAALPTPERQWIRGSQSAMHGHPPALLSNKRKAPDAGRCHLFSRWEDTGWTAASNRNLNFGEIQRHPYVRLVPLKEGQGRGGEMEGVLFLEKRDNRRE